MIKKTIIILASLFTFIGFSQNINGVYKSNRVSFMSGEDSSKDYFLRPCDYIIIVDINDIPNTYGSVMVNSKDENGETFSLKFNIKTEKKYYYEDNNTYLYYDAKMSIYGKETIDCRIVFDVGMKTFNVIYDLKTGTTQQWDLTSKL